MTTMKPWTAAILALSLSACATYPVGPSVTALPGSGRTFDQFRFDDANCRAYAAQMTGSATQQAANKGAIDSAAAGTMIGAAAGALIGAASGDPGAGAAIGAGSGLLLGSAAGTDAYTGSASRTQANYDTAYVQCMYGHGHQVPVPASLAAAPQSTVQSSSRVAASPTRYPAPGTPAPPGY